MRNRACNFGIAFGFAIALSVAPTAFSQTQKSPAATKAPASAKIGPRDLSGVWMDDHARPNSVTERYWIYKFTFEEPPMTAWGQAQFDAAKSSFGSHPYPLMETNDPIYHTCTPPGFPRIYLHPFPFQIVQTQGEVIVLFEYDSMRHQIFTDGRGHDTALGPQWNGDSVGHWEGDTLVADTVNLNDKTWLDRMGHPHSDQLHVVERFRRVDSGHLTIDFTFEDPKAYTKLWSAHMTYALHPKWSLGEQFCEDENSFEEIESNEVKPMK
jgi:hypothetical protein